MRETAIFGIQGDNFRIYVKKWSQIFNEFDRHDTILQMKLQLERDKLIGESKESRTLSVNN